MPCATARCESAARRPAGPSNPGCNAGVSFTALRDAAPLPYAASSRRFFVERLAELAEGAANLDVYRTAAVNYLNDGSADSPASTTPFSGLNNASANYDARVRGLVAMLMTSPRFQEQ